MMSLSKPSLHILHPFRIQTFCFFSMCLLVSMGTVRFWFGLVSRQRNQTEYMANGNAKLQTLMTPISIYSNGYKNYLYYQKTIYSKSPPNDPWSVPYNIWLLNWYYLLHIYIMPNILIKFLHLFKNYWTLPLIFMSVITLLPQYILVPLVVSMEQY